MFAYLKTLAEDGNSMNQKIHCLRNYLPKPTLILYCIAIVAIVIHILFWASQPFAAFFNRYPASVFRTVLATISGVLPFSLAEAIIIALPLILVTLLIIGIRKAFKSSTASIRFLSSLFAALTGFYSLFVFTFAAGYAAPTLEEYLSLQRHSVTAEELYHTATALIDEINALSADIPFQYASSSVMPYSISEMNILLNEAYETVCKTYDFIPHMNTHIKPVVLSEPMTYTHISGVYTYYTGEANLNIHFPDYTLPSTAAHELSHQRGIAREDEANFMAFLVCCSSDDSYIRYSGYQNLLEYVLNALYQANPTLYQEAISSLNRCVRYEMAAYNSFFSKYRQSVVSSVSGAVNDTFLKVQGQSDGARSYGRVVDLAVAYFETLNTQQKGEVS